MGNAGVAGRRERALDGSCLVETLAAMELSPEVNALLAVHASEVLDEIVAGGGTVAAVATPVMMAAIALAIDRGVRIVVVVVGGPVERVEPAAAQLRAVAWPLVFASSEPQVWETDLAHIRKHVGRRGIVVACARNARHLDRVRELIERIDGGAYPALVIEEQAEELASARTQARLGELRRLLRRVTMRG
jgi:hypothetical protein